MENKKENIIEVKDLCKTFVINKRQNNILKNVSFDIKKGEMVAIMGPSGSGKSTLLYAVSGMDQATSGEIHFQDKDIVKLKGKELAETRLEDMGFVFQQMYMLKNLTIFDNIILPACQSKKSDRSKTQIKQRGEEIMRKLGIIDIADNDINEVSGGQLQRACICRSMINDPKIVFADEPTGALNRTSSEEVMEEFLKLNREGTTIMMVTHDAKVAAKCQRILYLVDGNIEGELELGEMKSPDEMRDRERKANNWLMDLGW